jgi:tRNA G18 (ribose-2'-O)-methylase SpoU
VLHLPFAIAEPWPGVLDGVVASGFCLVALTPNPAIGEPLEALAKDHPGRVAIAVGAEGPGLSAEVLARSERRVAIAMAPGADSLNVSVAAAIALHRLGPLRPAGIGPQSTSAW